jgi:hypothetical protein
LREYFARQLRMQQPDAWRAAHRRLYEHLSATTKEGDQPTLEDLQPLYQAVAHGCQAGSQREALYGVYHARIKRRDENYSSRKLGVFGSDLGAVACFFEQPWTRLSNSLGEIEQAWLLNETALRLRALGRLTEALDPMRAAVEMAKKASEETKDEQTFLHRSKEASAYAGNLSELELTLGGVAGAVGDAEQSVIYADRSGDAFQRRSKRATHADALHQAGLWAEAETRFREAEQMQAKDEPEYPLLYTVLGFRYCDLLLAAPERAAWQEMQKSEVRSQKSELVQQCRAVSRRATKMFEWRVPSDSLLDIGLDNLTVGRVALYEVVLAVSGLPFKPQNSELKTSIDTAVDGLRRAAFNDYVVHGLLTRAWLHFLNGARIGPESAQSDLDEAWEIAERGPMRLLMADIHLYRARLFHGVKPYPWATDADGNARGPKDDLAAARKLIEQCGYWRRKEELEDAEEAAKDW